MGAVRRMDQMELLMHRLPESIAQALRALPPHKLESLEEIRTYAGGRIELVIAGKTLLLAAQADMQQMLAALSAQALYSCERQMAEGYIPLPGGHRAGVCGRMIREMDGAWRMTDVTSACIRISRRIAQVSLPVRPFLLDLQGNAQRVLVLGAPGCGKTTLLRDAALWLAGQGLHVAVADEREELFAGGGKAERLHVLSGMDKAHAFSMLLRSMAPQIIVSDEIGSMADAQAVEDAARCGAGLLVSAHARSMEEAARRPAIRCMLEQEAFDWYILLGRRASLQCVFDYRGNLWKGDQHGQLGYGCDGDACDQRSGLSALGWRKAACALGACHAQMSAAHEQCDPL